MRQELLSVEIDNFGRKRAAACICVQLRVYGKIDMHAVSTTTQWAQCRSEGLEQFDFISSNDVFGKTMMKETYSGKITQHSFSASQPGIFLRKLWIHQILCHVKLTRYRYDIRILQAFCRSIIKRQRKCIISYSSPYIFILTSFYFPVPNISSDSISSNRVLFMILRGVYIN